MSTQFFAELTKYFPDLEEFVKYEKDFQITAPKNIRVDETHQGERPEDLERYGEPYTLFTVYIARWFFYLEVTHQTKKAFITGYSYQNAPGLQLLPDTAPVELREMFSRLFWQVLQNHLKGESQVESTATSWT